ncbi:Ropporin-1-like protein [Acromyrmex echinatior]|uniref:Ropporin-1-like protein n=1 Tax=Acromyrmex echinatior TaxID=103372 RepID=F4WIY9_ACREC|nr:Ropporin-1-like protein [Acromyrmex echinatior]
MSDSQTKRIYCAEQINVPPTFPHILRLYAKAAIRTQPTDLLRWTAVYFRALANGEVPPAKDRLEYPSFIHPSGITPGYLKTMLNRFGHVKKVSLRALLLDCQGLDLSEMTLYQLFIVAGLLEDKEYCDFYRFLAVACGFLGNNLLETMIYVCELLTHEPEGGSAMIPLRIFLDLYRYLADLDCSGERRKAERVDSSCDTTTSVSNPSSSGMIDLTTRADNCDVDVQKTTDDAFEFNSEEESEEERITSEAINCKTTFNLKTSSEICRCRSEPESDQTPPPDPLKEFLKRMRAEIEAGRLETIFRVSGIGPPVSSERVTAVGLWLADCARRQEGLVGPRNIRHFLCPNFDDTPERDCT